MKVTYNWLKDFVNIKIPAPKLAEKLTMAGLEVTSLEARDGDFVFEIEITSNRPDWLSVVGIAREVAAITKSKIKNQKSKILNAKRSTLNAKDLRLQIENKEDCPLYTAKIIRGVKVGPAPEWLRKRLELVGCRSINNIVDITNYVLLETGEPLHAFDLDKIVLSSSIVVRRARKDERLVTIDDIERVLDENILVIAGASNDRTKEPKNERTGTPIAIAGVMGGKETEVTEGTQNILLEAAVFNPIVTRRSRQLLGLQTESSYRFERGVNIEAVNPAALRAVELIEKLAGGSCVLVKGVGLAKQKKKIISLSSKTIESNLGIKLASTKVKRILISLGFKVKAKVKNSFIIEVPPHRGDVNLDVDIIEEVARIYGYDLIPADLPRVKPRIKDCGARGLVSIIKSTLMGLGANEAITYSLVDSRILEGFVSGAPASLVGIENPLSREQEVLRPTLIPSLLRAVSCNINQKQDYINLFEVAKKFILQDEGPQEELVLCMVVCGVNSLLLQQGVIKDTSTILHLKGLLGTLFMRLGIKDYGFNTLNSGLVSVEIMGEAVGFLMEAPSTELGRFDIKNKSVYAAEINLDKVFRFVDLKKKLTALPRYPGIIRDISCIVKEGLAVNDILAMIKNQGGELLREVRVTDYYKGKQIPDGFRSLTISCLYRSDERTLTEEEINPLHERVCCELGKNFEVKIR